MTKQQLGALINDCESLQLHTIQNLNKFEVERFNQSQINQKLDMAIDMLKDLDNIDTNMVQTLFEYQKLIKSQLQDTMTQVAQEHKSGFMDPMSLISKMQTGKIKKRGRE